MNKALKIGLISFSLIIISVIIIRLFFMKNYYDFSEFITLRNKIVWSESRKLKFSDFNFTTDSESNGLYVKLGLSARYNAYDPIMFRSYTLFDLQNSTISDSTDLMNLRVAQTKFDLLEVYRRKMEKEVDSLRKLKNKKFKPDDFNNLNQRYYNNFKNEWKKYLDSPNELKYLESLERKINVELQRNEIKEYYSNDSSFVFKKIVQLPKFDSIYYFYDNGNLFKKGKQYKENQKFGNWELYDRDSNLREIREWFTVNGNSRINRAWNLNKNGDTLAYRYQDSIYNQKEFINDTIPIRYTNYDVIFFNQDTLSLNESIKGYIEIFSSQLKDNPSNIRVHLATDEANYNYDFSNEEEVELVKFNDLSIDTINQKWFKGAKFNKLATFGLYFDSVGEKKLRGYYQEYSFGPFKEKENGQKIDSIIGPKIFFEKKLIVIDSIKKHQKAQQL